MSEVQLQRHDNRRAREIKRIATFAFLACMAGLALAQEPGLKIVVVAGEGSVNIIDRKTAVPPVVEVRDRNDLPVAGVLVRFAIDGQGAAFQNGLRQVTITTNSVGRAAVAQLNPLGSGAFQIQVQATYQGQTASAIIQQTNFATAAQAAEAGRVASQGTQTSGSSGMNAATKVGIIGGAAAVGVGVALAQAGDGGSQAPANRPPTVGGIATSRTIALQSSTVISFSVPAGDPDNDPLTYAWDFGDGANHTAPAPTHVYNRAGIWTVRVTVSDGTTTASGFEARIDVRSLTGRWRMAPPPGVDPGPVPIEFLDLTQSGGSITGTYVISGGPDDGVANPVNGTVIESSPAITLNVTRIRLEPVVTFTFTGDPSISVEAVNGVRNGSGFANFPTAITRQ